VKLPVEVKDVVNGSRFLEGGSVFGAFTSLGDHFVLSAIALECARHCQKLYIPSHVWAYPTIRCLYQDVSNIEVVPFKTLEDHRVFHAANNLREIVLPPISASDVYFPGMKEVLSIPVDWERQIYEQAELSYHRRYTGFKLPNKVEGADELYEKLTEGESKYALFHQQSGTNPDGYHILIEHFRRVSNLPDMKIIEIREGTTENLLQYITLISNATEIHGITSSFLCLVDSIATQIPAKLFLHDIRLNFLTLYNCKWNGFKWNRVQYFNKY